MKTITFATTQMNLINCVEFLHNIQGHHTLFILVDSKIRRNQLMNLLNNPVYAKIFNKIVIRPNTNYRLINFFLTCCYLMILRFISKKNNYDAVVTGNYRNYAARLIYKLQKNKVESCKLIVCDDGLATAVIAKERLIELNTGKPYLFIPNRIVKVVNKKRVRGFIPQRITYYTTYNIPLAECDRIIRNNYHYIKNNLDKFNVDKHILECSVVMLGQPLYSKNYIRPEKYSSLMKKYSETIKGTAVYYAHPEESYKVWEKLKMQTRYIYVDNFIPFEIIAAMLPSGCRVVGFMTSVLMNLKEMNDNLRGECILISEEDLINKSVYKSLLLTYQHYRAQNIKFYEFN